MREERGWGRMRGLARRKPEPRRVARAWFGSSRAAPQRGSARHEWRCASGGIRGNRDSKGCRADEECRTPRWRTPGLPPVPPRRLSAARPYYTGSDSLSASQIRTPRWRFENADFTPIAATHLLAIGSGSVMHGSPSEPKNSDNSRFVRPSVIARRSPQAHFHYRTGKGRVKRETVPWLDYLKAGLFSPFGRKAALTQWSLRPNILLKLKFSHELIGIPGPGSREVVSSGLLAQV